MLIFASLQPLVPATMTMTERKKTMRMMIMARGRIRMTSLSLKRTNALNCINVCVHARGGHLHQALLVALLTNDITKHYI